MGEDYMAVPVEEEGQGMSGFPVEKGNSSILRCNAKPLRHELRGARYTPLHLIISCLFGFVLASLVFRGDSASETNEIKKEDSPQVVDMDQSSSSVSVSVGSKANKNQKYFVLHVGPQKTATTFLQGEASWYEKKTFPLDNYMYTGKSSTRGPMYDAIVYDRDCRQEVQEASDNGDPMPNCWKTGFTSALESFGDSSILLSSEDVRVPDTISTPEWWKVLKETSEAHGYKVVVIVAYRRLYEWLPSAYRQQQHGKLNSSWSYWPSENPTHPKIVESFAPQFLDSEYVDRNNGEYKFFKWTASYLEAIPDFMDVRVLNHYSKGSTSVKFFCHLMPNADHTCQQVKQFEKEGKTSPGSLTKHNFAHSVFYDALIVAAAEKGLVNTSAYERRFLDKATLKYNEEKLNQSELDLPLICPDKESTYILLKASLDWEKELMPQMDDEDAHRDGYQSYVDGKKYCFIDLEATLELQEWKEFFKQYS